LTFYAFGDTRDNPSTMNTLFQRMLNEISAEPTSQTILLHSGDFNGSTGESQWDGQYFKRDTYTLQHQARVPMAGVWGNHDSNTDLRNYFPWPYALSSGNTYYSFEYGPVFFAAIDVSTSFSTGSAQYNWLESKLQSTSKAIKILFFHYPGYGAGDHSNDSNVQNYIQPLCVKYNVRFCITGHNHNYARCVQQNVNHMTLGGGGAPLYDVNSNCLKAEKTYHFAKFKVYYDMNTLEYVISTHVIRSVGTTLETFDVRIPYQPSTPVKADFTYSADAVTRKVQFTDASTCNNCTITSWNWNFGDALTSTLKNPLHTYGAAGTYSVTLTVTNSSSQADAITKTVVLAAPAPVQAKFSYTKNDLSVTFTDESISSGTIQSWLWEFGDGITATIKNPSHTYPNYGKYTVKLTVTDNVPSSNTKTEEIELNNYPPDPCASAGTDFSYFWISKADLGTLSNSSAGTGYSDFTKTVAAVELKQGSSYNLTITLNTGQYTNWFKAYIDYNRDGDFEDAGEVIFVSTAAQKIISDGGSITIPANAATGITRLRLQIKNSTSSNLPAPEPCETFAYGEVEDYYVNIVSDCQPPAANFNYAVNQCTAAFTNTSTSATPIVSYNWNFGNGSTSVLANPSCTYTANGTYNVSLTVTNNCGKSASISKQVIITNCPNLPYDHLVGSFPGIGIWIRDSQTQTWTQLSKQQADIIRVGDVNGNGQDDTAAYFKSTGKLWYRYDSGVWEDIPASAATLTVFDLGDMDNDGKDDLVGSWSDKGLWWRNSANGVWTKLSNLVPSLVAAGDFDSDSKADVAGLFPSMNSIWIYYSNNTWKQISKQINLIDLRAGNMDSDTAAELVGSWDIGVWTFDPATNAWVQHHKQQAKQIAVGDINAGGKQDIAGYWDASLPLYVKYLETNTWLKLSNYNPDTLDAGAVK
jgi:PKD repeat protein